MGRLPGRADCRACRDVKTTWYYDNVARFAHPEISEESARAIIRNPEYVEVQPDGRIRHYGLARFKDGSVTIYAGGIALTDGETLFNVFPDGSYTKDKAQGEP